MYLQYIKIRFYEKWKHQPIRISMIAWNEHSSGAKFVTPRNLESSVRLRGLRRGNRCRTFSRENTLTVDKLRAQDAQPAFPPRRRTVCVHHLEKQLPFASVSVVSPRASSCPPASGCNYSEASGRLTTTTSILLPRRRMSSSSLPSST